MNATASLSTIEINGVTYAPVGSSPNTLPAGNRHVVVIDRGWIVDGDGSGDGSGTGSGYGSISTKTRRKS